METAIFNRKKILAKRLLKISVEDLKNAPKQSWYGEYLALLSIRLPNSNDIIEELTNFYKENMQKPERELAVLGMIQFMNPQELFVPFHQNFWNKIMINDVGAVFLNNYTSTNYSDDEISAYWLWRQAQWKYERRKIRVAFILQAHITADKIFPVYEAMKRREDMEPFLILHSDENYRYKESSWAYFRQRYPQDKIYDSNSLFDLKILKPDYVFLLNPYEERRPFPSFRVNDLMKFTKVCMITYGANLSYNVVNRLFDDYKDFWRNVYFVFASSETSKVVMTEKFPNLQRIEFLGYPALKTYYKLENESSTVKRIMWAPRWVTSAKNAERIGGSHFLKYKENFISLRKKYGDKIELVFRPHTNLFYSLLQNKIMTKDKINEYRKRLKDNRIVHNFTAEDMDKSIRDVDIFIADYSSILIEFFLTGRPIIYCEFKNAAPFPEYAEMFAAMYIARSWKDVERHLDNLMTGNDPLFDKRQEISQKIYETHKDATEKIIARLVQDFNQNISERSR